jgi:chemotaxis protein CheD
MPEPEGTLPEIYVQPGESHLVKRPAILRTVLGSCVGVVFLVPRLGIGALCHPMLPRFPANKAGKMNVAAGRRYVDFAIRDMVRQLDALGAERAEAEVKLFGGGDVLLVADGSSRPTVGRLNCEAALRVLEEEGFTISASRLGGTAGVHIQVETGTGEVMLRRLDSDSIGEKQQSSRAIHRAGRRHLGQ